MVTGGSRAGAGPRAAALAGVLCLLGASCDPAILEPVRERVVGPEGRIAESFEVRRPAEAIEIDGRLGEWLAADAVLLGPIPGGVISLLWDDGYLYASARVTDHDADIGNAAAGHWAEEDAVALGFDLDPGGPGDWTAGRALFALVPDPEGRVTARWWRQGHPTGAIERPAPEGVELGVRQWSGGYVVEAAIPLGVLAHVTGGRLPPSFGFFAQISDPEPEARVTWVGRLDDPSSWGTVSLLEYVDADADGYPAPTDCDDGAASVNPGAAEDPGNHRDDDCDGETDEGGAGLPTLEDLWHGRAAFEVDQDPLSLSSPGPGVGGAFAVNRSDVTASTLYLYYRCGIPHSSATHSICLAVSDDGGETWPDERGEVVAPQPGHSFAISPTVVHTGHRWVMAYEESHDNSVFWAESSDGLTWTQQGELVGRGGSTDWDADAAASPGLVVDDRGEVALLRLLYAGLPAGGVRSDIGMAAGETIEGVEKLERNPVFHASAEGWSRHTSSPRLMREGVWYYLFYEGATQLYRCGDPFNRFGWGVARSRDLDTWERWPGNPIRQTEDDACGFSRPNPFRRYDGRIFVYRTSEDGGHLVREALVAR